MTITFDNVAAHELIGLKVKVARSADPSIRGVAGIVRDETRNMFKVEFQGRLISIPKADSSFIFEFPEGAAVSIEGSRLRFRPEDRVKKCMAKW